MSPSKDSSVRTRVPSPSAFSSQTWIARIPGILPDQTILWGGSTSSNRDTILELPAVQSKEVPASNGPFTLIFETLLFQLGHFSRSLKIRHTVSIGALI